MGSAQPVLLGPREVFARLQEVVLKFDMDAQADLYAEDGVLEWPFAPEDMPRRVAGREAIRRVLVPLGERARAAGHRLLEYQSLVVHDTSDPEVIIAEFDVRGEIVPSGRPYQLSYVQVLRVRDGRIVTFRDYWNPQALSSLLAHAETLAAAAPM